MRIPLQHSRRLITLILAICCDATLCVGIAFSGLKSPDKPTIKILRETQALELIATEVTSNGNLLLVFKNVSARDINGFVLAISGGPEITFDTSTGDRVIASQATEDLEIPAGSQVPEITILAVMFADGNLEGNEITVAQLKQRRGALKRELKRGLAMIRDVAGSPDANSPAIFEKLESAISNLEIDPSSQSSGDTGLVDAKQDLFTAIRDVRTRQERNGYLKQRERLQELCNRIERRIATL
jgi:hypothetical protein